jgi:hypothetical protein
MASGESGSRILTAAMALALALGFAALSGCSSTSNAGAAGEAKTVEMSFDLTKCQQIDANMYRCPAVDKPICNPAYTPAGVECIKIGKKGGVIVSGPAETE